MLLLLALKRLKLQSTVGLSLLIIQLLANVMKYLKSIINSFSTWSWFRNLWWNRPPPEILEGIEENIIQSKNHQ